ncbi:Glyoxylase, beta-lactamase superfamily II [Roseomonas rosea]|uniref:Glyoxylase, beta-lactamase superfamily II n=1 Tax=Muricoccus roseus TaxID=198092 RepID=A0A1M6IP23_9PROT|nr:MBL fold metallo-hydrolase [Roseomonas rosea]SHJ36188.1 Glyoxylase, beta-lactamase superfamily II [Roseomonas rosea]
MQRRAMLAAGLAAPALLTAGEARAQAPAPAQPQPVPPQAPGYYRFLVGQHLVTMLHDGQAIRPNPTQGFVRNASAEEVTASMRAQGLNPAQLVNPFTVPVVRTPRGTVMFDTGNGPQTAADSRVGQLPANLSAAGIDPASIDIVAFTHFHGDHVGGLLDGSGNAAFPRARIIVPEKEWAFWMDEGQASRAPEAMRPAFANVRRRFAPYESRIERVAEGAEILPGLRLNETPGHTPGHSSYHLSDGDAQAMILGDLTSRPEFNLTNPGWHVIFDMDPAQAEATRRRVFDRVATDRIRCVAYHWPFPANGTVLKEGNGYRLVPAEWSSVV